MEYLLINSTQLGILVFYALSGITVVLIGVLLSLVIRFPYFANLGRNGGVARAAKISFPGIASLLLAFLVIVSLSVGAEYLFCWHSVDNYGQGRLQTSMEAILKELWVRRVVPPSLYHPCHLGDIYVCNLADAVSAASNLADFTWVWEIIMSLTSALITAALAWVYTRQ